MKAPGTERATRQPMLRGRGTSEESRAMDLPDGKTCADCRHCYRCCAIFGHVPEDEVCDFYPSRFSAALPLEKVEEVTQS